MSSIITCPGCKVSLRVPSLSGQVVNCPQCRTAVQVPISAHPARFPIGWITVVILASTLSAALAFAAGWFVGKNGQPARVQIVGIGDPEKMAKGKKPVEEMTWQQLQDKLAEKGIKTKRWQGKRDMWFAIGVTEQTHDALAMHGVLSTEDLVREGGRSFFDRFAPTFVVSDHPSAEIAAREAARIKDTYQRESLAWNRFVFDGSPETLTALKTALE